MEVVAIFSVCFMLNLLGVYTATEPLPQTPGANVAETNAKKARVARRDESGQGSLVEAWMALNQPEQ